MEEGAYASLLLRDIDDRDDIGFISHVVYGTLRNERYLYEQWKTYAKKVSTRNQCLLDMSVYQLFFLDSIQDYTVVNEAVKLVSDHDKGFINAVLRNVIREGKKDFEDVAIQTSHPDWIMNLWKAQYGEEIAEKIAKANIEIPTVYGRIADYHLTKDDFKDEPFTFIDDRIYPMCAEAIIFKISPKYTMSPFPSVIV